MKYSEILRDHFRLRLSPFQFELVDALFLLSSHHFQRAREKTQYCKHHVEMFGRAARALFLIISQADFSQVVDPDGTGLTSREAWLPPESHLSTISEIVAVLPDEFIFHSFPADRRFTGPDHPYDILLANPS
jgi:hypothetical protein